LKGNLHIPVHIINLKHRKDRLEHSMNEFFDRKEFSPNIVEAYSHKVGSMGLWLTIKQIVQSAHNTCENDFVIICEDDHQFTKNYSKEILFSCINEAREKDADVLLGGISWLTDAVQVSERLFWVDMFSATNFLIIFKKNFLTILNADFKISDTADYKICDLTNKIFFIYPFISVQKDFGYSDATPGNNQKGKVEELFSKTSIYLKDMTDVRSHYLSNPQENLSNEEIAEMSEEITIPTYIIPELQIGFDSVTSTNIFPEKPEFNMQLSQPATKISNEKDIWENLRAVISAAIDNDDDLIIICKQDIEFTSAYSKKYLLQNIFVAHAEGADILCGDVQQFSRTVPIAPNRFWIDAFSGSALLILFKKFFQKILDEPYNESLKLDQALSQMTSNKMVLFPFITTSKSEALHSVGKINDKSVSLFSDPEQTQKRLATIQQAYLKYIQPACTTRKM
jgi:hypothetical protein